MAIAFFLAGVGGVLVTTAAMLPNEAEAQLERPTGTNNPACRLPAGSCVRLFYPPTPQEIEDLNLDCYDVVYVDPASGQEYFWPHSCETASLTQNIGF